MAKGRVNEGRLEVVASDVAKLRPLALASAFLDLNCKPAPKIDERLNFNACLHLAGL
jgi:hypothetical protein